VAFHAIMGGHVAAHFTVKMVLIATMVVLGAIYLFARPARPRLRLGISAGLVLVLLVFLLHPPFRWLTGSRAVWAAGLVVIMVLFLVFLWGIAPKFKPNQAFWQWSKLAVGLLAFSAFLIGGFVRERSRSPYTVYKEIVKPEVVDAEADRFLFYDKCLGCHQVADISAFRGRDWRAIVASEQERPGVALAAGEAARISRYLQGAYK